MGQQFSSRNSIYVQSEESRYFPGSAVKVLQLVNLLASHLVMKGTVFVNIVKPQSCQSINLEVSDFSITGRNISTSIPHNISREAGAGRGDNLISISQDIVCWLWKPQVSSTSEKR